RPHGRGAGAERRGTPRAQPDPRARVPGDLRPRRGVHPAVRARPRAPTAQWRRCAGPRAARLRQRGSQAHRPVQALPRAVRRGIRQRLRDDRAARAIGAEVLRHDPLAVALVILMIEWMTQSHYLDSVRDDGGLDPLFKSLLRHHWMEEAQHAKRDTLMVEALAEGRSEPEIQAALDEFLEIGVFLDGGLKAQVGLNIDALEAATGRKLGDDER